MLTVTWCRAKLRSSKSMAWSGLCAALAGLCIVVWLLPVEAQIAMRWHVDTWTAQPWVLWTAGLTHLSDIHLLANLLALFCLSVLGQLVDLRRSDALALLLAWPAVHLGLLLWPQIQFYSGFSGLNHALAGIIIARAAIDLVANKHLSVPGVMLAIVMLAKLIREAAWTAPLGMDASWGFAVVQAAHLTGVLSGVLTSVLLKLVLALLPNSARALCDND
jgi:rhomboid family GlyGly-CTERM serine protease